MSKKYEALKEKYQGRLLAIDETAHQHLIEDLKDVTLELGVPEEYIVVSINDPQLSEYSEKVRSLYYSLVNSNRPYHYFFLDDEGEFTKITNLIAGMLIRNFRKTVYANFAHSILDITLKPNYLFVKNFPTSVYTKLNDDMYAFRSLLYSRDFGVKTLLCFSYKEELDAVFKHPQLRTLKGFFSKLNN